MMKKLEIMIQPDKLDMIRKILEESDVTEYYMIDVMKNSNQTGRVKKYRGAEYQVTQITQIKVETVIADNVAETLISRIINDISTNNSMKMSTECVVDEKIFVYDVQDAINIQTGDRGERALS